MEDNGKKLLFEVEVTEKIEVKNTYLVLAHDMAEATMLVEQEKPHLVHTHSKYNAPKPTELVEEVLQPEHRRIHSVYLAHNNSGGGRDYRQTVYKDLQNLLKQKLEVSVQTYNANYGIDGLLVGSHRFVVFSRLSEDKTTLNVVVTRRSLSTGAHFMDSNSRLRQLSPEEQNKYGELIRTRDRHRGLLPDALKEIAPDLVQSTEVFSATDYENFLEKLAGMIKEAKPCVGAMERNAQGKSRICNSCPYQLACLSSKV